MKKEVKRSSILKKPEYSGGTKALRTFISNHLVYPSEALDQQIEGTVHLRYGIDHHGKVIDVHVIKGVGGGCTEEATRLVRLLQFNLERTRGIKVLFHKKIQIHFRLPATLPTQQSAPAVQYAYTTPARQIQSTPEKKKSYTITINYPA